MIRGWRRLNCRLPQASICFRSLGSDTEEIGPHGHWAETGAQTLLPWKRGCAGRSVDQEQGVSTEITSTICRRIRPLRVLFSELIPLSAPARNSTGNNFITAYRMIQISAKSKLVQSTESTEIKRICRVCLLLEGNMIKLNQKLAFFFKSIRFRMTPHHWTDKEIKLKSQFFSSSQKKKKKKTLPFLSTFLFYSLMSFSLCLKTPKNFESLYRYYQKFSHLVTGCDYKVRIWIHHVKWMSLLYNQSIYRQYAHIANHYGI